MERLWKIILMLFWPKIKIPETKVKKKTVPIVTYNETFKSPNFSKRKSEIDSIIVHHTGGLMPGCRNWLCDSHSKVSAHILIDTNGQIYKLVGFYKRAWHAGRGAFDLDGDGNISPAEKMWNDRSIGIELEAIEPYNYTNTQTDALYRVVYNLFYEFPRIVPDHVLGHKEIAPDRKIDPANFSMELFRRKLKEMLA